MSDKISYVALKNIWRSKLIVFIFLMAISSTFIECATTAVHGQIPTTFVFGIDGVSYYTFKKMQEGGHFRTFTPVSPMVSSFPSISDPNWNRLYALEPEKGFNKAFYDPAVKTANGLGAADGGLSSHWNRQPKYEVLSDFKPDGAVEHLSTYIWTETTASYWLQSLEKKFFDFRGRDTYFALVINSDLISHTEGEASVMKYLAEIDQMLERMQKNYKQLYGHELEIILVSDHGNTFYNNPPDVPFEEELKKMNWNLVDSISKQNEYAFNVPEMLSFGSFFTHEKSKREFALALDKVSHVSCTMYEIDSQNVRVICHQGNTEVQITVIPNNTGKDKASEYLVSYKLLKGKDPFDQIKLFDQGPLPDVKYFQKTIYAKYPNVALRIWEGFNKNSKIKPHVLVDPEVNYVFGNRALRLMTDMRGFASTHGSLYRDQALGIITSTKRQMPEIRPQDFRHYVNVKNIGSSSSPQAN